MLYGAASVGVPGVLMEHSFHTNKSATNWLLADANLRKLAAAEAKTIAEHYGLTRSSEKSDNAAEKQQEYRVRVTIDDLNIRKGPGTNYPTTGKFTGKGVFTIVETQGTWGRLKSGAGWISLNYATKI